MDIEAVPQIADSVAKIPFARDLDGCIEGHGKAGHQEVGDGEADEEVVVDVPELVVPAINILIN